MMWKGHLARMGKMKYLYTILVEKCEYKYRLLLGKPRCRCEYNIKIK